MKKKILIVSAPYYKNIVDQLVDGAKNFLQDKNELIISEEIAPGAFEIPYIINSKIEHFDAFIALGCVIKGQTPHFDFISKATTDAIMKISIDIKKPIGNGIITCLNMKQAKARKNKGKEAVKAILSVLSQK